MAQEEKHRSFRVYTPTEKRANTRFYLDQVRPHVDLALEEGDGTVNSIGRMILKVVSYKDTHPELTLEQSCILSYLMMGLVNQVLTEIPEDYVEMLYNSIKETTIDFSRFLRQEGLVPVEKILTSLKRKCPICGEFSQEDHVFHLDHWACEVCAHNSQEMIGARCPFCTEKTVSFLRCLGRDFLVERYQKRLQEKSE